MFKRIARVHCALMFLNLLLLLFVTAFPFPTSTWATYRRPGGQDANLAAALYGVAVEGVALSFWSICRWSSRHQLFNTDVDQQAAGAATRRYGGGAIVVASTIGLAFLSAIVALGVHGLIAAYYKRRSSAKVLPAIPDRV